MDLADRPTSPEPDDLSRVIAFLRSVDNTAAELGYEDPALRSAYHTQVMRVLTGAFIEVFGASARNPDWLPYLPYYLSRLAPNPDTVNGFAPIDPNGIYRFTGVNGTETIAAITLREGGAHLGQRSGKRVGEIDLLDVPMDDQRRFSFILSAEQPVNSKEHWIYLDPRTTCLMSRRVMKSHSQVEGTCAILRLDSPPSRASAMAEELSAKMAAMVEYASSQNAFLMKYMNHLRDRGASEGFIIDDQTDYGGLVVQVYYFHVFDLADDECLILESDAPSAKYWSIQVIDPFATTLDYTLHQSSLNDTQARADPDGRVRVVLSADDLGVANWLDPIGWRQGGIIWRWNLAERAPQPTVTKIKTESLRKTLPSDTLWVSPEQRREILNERTIFYQSRRR